MAHELFQRFCQRVDSRRVQHGQAEKDAGMPFDRCEARKKARKP
jgi:hypothetical protein